MKAQNDYEEDDFEKPFYIETESSNHAHSKKRVVRTRVPYRESVLWDQVYHHINNNNQHHEYKLKFGEEEENDRKTSQVAQPTVKQLRSQNFIRRKYGLPSKLTTNDSNAEWRRQRLLVTKQNLNPLNFDHNNLLQLRNGLSSFQNVTTRHAMPTTSDRNVLQRELNLELKKNRGYAKQLIEKAQSNNGGSSTTLTKVLETEMNRLIERGRKREAEMAQTILFISQYLLSETDLRKSIAGNSEKKQKKKSKIASGQMVPVNYDITRRKLFNKAVMKVFDDKHKDLFDPFHLGLEPPIQPEAYDPLLFEFSVFNPPESKKKDAIAGNRKANTNLQDTTLYRRQQGGTETIPMIPMRMKRRYNSSFYY